MPRPGATAFFGLVLLASAACRQPSPPRPPVVLVVLDALHARHVSHLGNPRPTTPHLDALADEAISFTHAFAPSPYTIASIPSLLTGRLPLHHGVVGDRLSLHPDEVTLAELLADAGYRTLGASANVSGGAMHGNEQGFEEFVELQRQRPGAPSHPAVISADEFPPIVERWLDAEDGRPPFVYLHVREPHAPFDAPDPHLGRFLPAGYEGKFRDGFPAEMMIGMAGQDGATQFPDQADRDAFEAIYDGNLQWADAIVGRLIAVLRDRGSFDDALVVVTSDHGEAFWQHGRQGHGKTLFDEEVHVPLVVKLPGRDDGGRRAAHLASILDVVPTVCQWLDLAPPPGLDGRPLPELLDAEDAGADDDRELLLVNARLAPSIAIRTKRDKTLAFFDMETLELRRVRHYDLRDDPGERRDLYPAREDALAGRVARLQERLRAARTSRAVRGDGASAAEREMLRSLGYAGDD